MKEYELRLGNLVIRHDVQDVPFTMLVCRIDGDGFVALSAGTYSVSCMMKELSGIPLTPDWLERAGFKPESQFIGVYPRFRHKESRHHIYLKDGKFLYRVPGVTLREIEFMHTLQNIFYSLTGTELTFTDPSPHH